MSLDLITPEDGLEAELRSFSRLRTWRARGARGTSFGNLTRGEVLERRDRAKVSLDAFVAASDADLAPLLHSALLDFGTLGLIL